MAESRKTGSKSISSLFSFECANTQRLKTVGLCPDTPVAFLKESDAKNFNKGKGKRQRENSTRQISGDDAPMGNTRSHSEHDSEDVGGRRYLVGDCPGE